MAGCTYPHYNMPALPLHGGLETGLDGEKQEARGDTSFPRKDLASVCSRSLGVGEKISTLCIFETFLGGG